MILTCITFNCNHHSFIFSVCLAEPDFQQLVDSTLLDAFSNSSRLNCFSINITNDTLFETDIENFQVDLKLPSGVTQVRIDPGNTIVNILDDDCKLSVHFNLASWQCVNICCVYKMQH